MAQYLLVLYTPSGDTASMDVYSTIRGAILAGYTYLKRCPASHSFLLTRKMAGVGDGGAIGRLWDLENNTLDALVSIFQEKMDTVVCSGKPLFVDDPIEEVASA